QDDGLIKLPPPRSIQRNKITIPFTSATEPGIERREPVHALAALELQLVSKASSKLWNEYMHRYHYLGYKNLPGAQLRYFVMVDKQILALLSFSASAWQCAPRDQYIGWTHEQRKKNLHLIINNSRFLILPPVCVLAQAGGFNPKTWLQRSSPKQQNASGLTGNTAITIALSYWKHSLKKTASRVPATKQQTGNSLARRRGGGNLENPVLSPHPSRIYGSTHCNATATQS
ncbi:MAG: DUF4338 domain-containing protein, partial [Mariprofundaceae bacterium]|nr:DUF4338 domain-containing protein [Mariprofundaceae bacterium]